MPNTRALRQIWSLFCLLLWPVSASAAEVECHANKNYSVAVQSYEDDAGAQFAITTLAGKKAPKTCRFEANKADFVIGAPGDPLWYADLSGKLLILTRSTGPQGDLLVYDLASRKPVLDVPSDDYTLEGGTLAFWQRTGEATAKTCPDFAEHQANGMGSVIAQRRLLNLKTLKVTETKERRCDATQ